MPGSLFDKDADLENCNFIKKRSGTGFFPVNFAKFLLTPFLQSTSDGCCCIWISKKIIIEFRYRNRWLYCSCSFSVFKHWWKTWCLVYQIRKNKVKYSWRHYILVRPPWKKISSFLYRTAIIFKDSHIFANWYFRHYTKMPIWNNFQKRWLKVVLGNK